MMNQQECQKRLAILWFVACAAIGLLMLMQTILGAYAVPKDAWNWLVPNILPTLSLMIGIFVADSDGAAAAGKQVTRFLFFLTFAISGAYLLVILLMILLQPFAVLGPVEMMKQGQMLWLGPLQGLVTASLGAFFVKARKPEAAGG